MCAELGAFEAMRRSGPACDQQIWLAAVGPAAGSSRDEVLSALRAQGLDPQLLAAGAAGVGGAGVVLFDDVTPELCRFVGERSDGERDYVLAIEAPERRSASSAWWSLLDAGAGDVFRWDPCDGPGAVAARLSRWWGVSEAIAQPSIRERLVGTSRAWRRLLRRVVETARFTDSPALITGESGTGKELVAQLIHELDTRPRKRNLVVLDCTTVVPTLSGSEFFGHERGAFTGADSARDGAFALADGGTLFLDEVGELPPALQAELLRVVQEGTYKRVGSNVWRETSFRLVCATNRNLLEETAEQRFRTDFYHRIAAWRIDLPSLRERREDIVPLTRHFLDQARLDQEPCELDEPVVEFLVGREYPGNVRDLRHLVTRIGQRHVGPGPITLGDIPEEERGDCPRVDWRSDGFEHSIHTALVLGAGLREITAAAADTAIRLAIREEDGSVQRASSRLGVTPRALQLRRSAQRDRQLPAP